MSVERVSSEIIPFDVMEVWRSELEVLQKQVDLAYKNRIAVNDLKLVLHKGDLEQALPKDAKNGVWVENPHMFPHLLWLAYEKIGFRGKKLQEVVREAFEHETDHLVPIIGSPRVRSRLGVRFYKAAFIPFLPACQAEIDYMGEMTLAEDLDVTTNVKRLSPDDRADLGKILKYAKKPR